MKNKKGATNINAVLAIVTVVVMSVIMIAIGLRITGGMKDQMSTSGTEYNYTNLTQGALYEIAEWSELIGLIAAAGIILVLVFAVIASRMRYN